MRDTRAGFSGAPDPGSPSINDARSASLWDLSGRKGPLKILCCPNARMGLRKVHERQHNLMNEACVRARTLLLLMRRG